MVPVARSGLKRCGGGVAGSDKRKAGNRVENYDAWKRELTDWATLAWVAKRQAGNPWPRSSFVGQC